MGDPWSAVEEGYREQLKRLQARHPDLLDAVSVEEAAALGAQGAAASVAPLLWGRAVGDRWDTTTAAEFLGISRQALNERVKRGTIVGLPGRGTTWFPTWQFDLVARSARPVVVDVVDAFRRAMGESDLYTVASWATTRQSMLDGLTPADWIGAGRDSARLIDAARRSARKLAS
jgi:hypothetical protein